MKQVWFVLCCDALLFFRSALCVRVRVTKFMFASKIVAHASNILLLLIVSKFNQLSSSACYRYFRIDSHIRMTLFI